MAGPATTSDGLCGITLDNLAASVPALATLLLRPWRNRSAVRGLPAVVGRDAGRAAAENVLCCHTEVAKCQSTQQTVVWLGGHKRTAGSSGASPALGQYARRAASSAGTLGPATVSRTTPLR